MSCPPDKVHQRNKDKHGNQCQYATDGDNHLTTTPKQIHATMAAQAPTIHHPLLSDQMQSLSKADSNRSIMAISLKAEGRY
jgi:hypothetical protein